jgi:hypothetical protein
MGRRFGKTVSQVMFLLACLRNIPNVKILIIANNSRAADEFMTQFKDFAARFFDMRGFEKDNEDKLFYRVSPSDVRMLKVYSGLSGNNLRGIGGDIVVFEEAGYFAAATFRTILPPLIAVAQTALIMISTLSTDHDNPFNLLMKSGIIDTFAFMMICDKCLEKGIKKECVHEADRRPGWHDEAKQLLVKTLMGSEDTYNREALGIQDGYDESEKKVFPPHLVQRFIGAPRVPLHKMVYWILVVIDPVAGSYRSESRMSDFAIITMAYPQKIILGMEAFDASVTEDYEPILIEHLKRVRQLPFCDRATLVIDAETGTGFAAGDIQKIVSTNFGNCYMMNHTKDGRKPGTLTTEAVKHDAARISLEMLHRDEFSIYEKLVTHSKEEDILKLFGSQLYAYERTIRAGHYHYSAKKAKHCDDLVVSFTRLARLGYEARFTLKEPY